MNDQTPLYTVTIFGLGNVGKAIVHQLLHQLSYSLIINIVDPSEEIEGAWLDISHAGSLHPHHELRLNNHNLVNHSDIIFHCAGVGVEKGADRMTTVQQNKEITNNIFKDFSPFKDTKIIVVSNPVDVTSYYTWKYSGLEPYKIIGTGTLLDTQRLNFYIKEIIGKDKTVDTMMIGEHGKSVVWLKSHGLINDLPLLDCLTKKEQKEIYDNVVAAASKIKETQDATIYGIADCAVFIMNNILNPSDIIFPASVLVPLSYKEMLPCNSIFMSVPIRINKDGAAPLEAVALLPEEKLRLIESARIIEKNTI